MPKNIRFLPMVSDLASLMTATRKVKLDEDDVLHIDRELWLILLSEMDDILNVIRHNKGPAGMWVSTMMNVVPFCMKEKIPPAEAQELVQCHWADGKRIYPTFPGFVERWDMRYNNLAWRCLCNEDGLMLQSPKNPLVSHMRSLMATEDVHRFGYGPIFGDALILNKNCGW